MLRRYLNADLGFHLLLLKAAENRRALTIFGDVNLRSAIFGCGSHQRDLHHVAWVWLGNTRASGAGTCGSVNPKRRNAGWKDTASPA